ncbi:MAG: thermonuclease family protein [Planctomycetota bacterium]
MRNKSLVITIITIVCLILGVLLIEKSVAQESVPSVPKYPVKDFKEQKTYKVAKIVDGNTVVLDIDKKEVKVRLIGVDTPQIAEYYGKEASNFTNNLLKGEEVYMEYENEKQEFDKYDRLLAYLYRVPDGLFVNLEIVRQGYGHSTEYPFKYSGLFNYYEKRARENEKGLWRPEIEKKDANSPASKPPEVKDNPDANDGQSVLESSLKGLVKVVSFKKTDGQAGEVFGVKQYALMYEAEIECLVDCFVNPSLGGIRKAEGMGIMEVRKNRGDHIGMKGQINFEKTEKGWNGKMGMETSFYEVKPPTNKKKKK